MKKLAFSLIVCSFIAVSVLHAQDAKPAAAPPTNYDPPKKPEKEPVTPEELYEAARWMDWNSDDSDGAIKLLDRAVGIKPDFSDAYYLRGHLHSRQDRCKEAISDFDVVIQLNPDAINTYQFRGECKTRLKDYPGALSDFDMSVSTLAAQGLVQYNAFEKRGRMKYILGNYDGAIEDFNNALNTGRGDRAHFLRALTYIRKNDTIGAIRDLNLLADYYEQVTKDLRVKFPEQYAEKKGYPPGQDPLASLVKKPVKAKGGSTEGRYYIVATSSGGTGSSGAANSATVAGCKGCKETKFAEFEDKLVPDNWFFPSEKTYLTSFISDSADVIFYLLGDIYEKRGDTAAALQAYTSSIVAKKYDQGTIYYRRGKVLLKTGEFEPAVRDFSWTISGLPLFADGYLERGVAILMLGHDELAQADFAKYLALNPAGKETLTARIDAAKKQREEMKKPGTTK